VWDMERNDACVAPILLRADHLTRRAHRSCSVTDDLLRCSLQSGLKRGQTQIICCTFVSTNAMLQLAAQRLVLLPQGMLQAACYSSAKLPNDYSLVMTNTQKELSNHVATPDNEIGACAGVPLETFKRKVGGMFADSSAQARLCYIPTACACCDPMYQWLMPSQK